MGYSKKRIDRNGKPRYTACYLDVRGSLRSAGTFSNKKDADRAWQQAETRMGEGRLNDPRRGRQTFRRYVTGEWLPHHVIEASIREAYTYQVGKHILPWFGPMRMNEIMPSHVREWVTDLQEKGVTPATIQKVRFILSAIFTTALDDVTFLHPCKGVKTPTVPRKPLKIITPEQFDAIYDELPDVISQLLTETDIETGLRWGELTELRVKDFMRKTRIITVSRTVVQVDPKFHPYGGRFLVKQYPKDGEYRYIKVSDQLADKIDAYIIAHGLGADDLIFPMPPQDTAPARLRTVPERATIGCKTESLRRRPPLTFDSKALMSAPSFNDALLVATAGGVGTLVGGAITAAVAYRTTLGFTKPNAAGRQYWHGTMSGYNAGKCRCQHCKDAAAIYRAGRRAGLERVETRGQHFRQAGRLLQTRADAGCLRNLVQRSILPGQRACSNFSKIIFDLETEAEHIPIPSLKGYALSYAMGLKGIGVKIPTHERSLRQT